MPDYSWEETRWGRIDQGRRELAVALGKDVTVEKLAELIGLASPSLWGWKQGSRPKEASIEALERIFLGAGLVRYTRHYIDHGPITPDVVTAPPERVRRQTSPIEEKPRRRGNAG